MNSESDTPKDAPSTKKAVVSFFGRYIVLLASLCVLFFVYPVLEELNVPRRAWYLNAMFIFVLFSAVATSAKNRTEFWIVVALAVPTMIIDWTTFLSADTWVYMTNSFFSNVFFSVICLIIIRDVMTSKTVTGDTIAGSICAYLILGLVWAMIYEFIELAQPGSFSIPQDLVTEGGYGHSVGFLSFAYYSFTTMTSLGYGDITPLSRIAQAFSPMQTVIGQLYLAILIARLVAMRVASSMSNANAS